MSFISKRVKIGEVELDASLAETHALSAAISTHPVETGSDVTDNIRPLPTRLSISGVVSNTPIVNPLIGIFTATNRVNAAYEKLEQYLQTGEVIDVFTTLRTYTDVVIESISIERDADTGAVLQCRLELVEIYFADTQTVQADSAEATAKVSNSRDPAQNTSKNLGGKAPVLDTSPTETMGATNQQLKDNLTRSLEFTP